MRLGPAGMPICFASQPILNRPITIVLEVDSRQLSKQKCTRETLVWKCMKQFSENVYRTKKCKECIKLQRALTVEPKVAGTFSFQIPINQKLAIVDSLKKKQQQLTALIFFRKRTQSQELRVRTSKSLRPLVF